MTSSARCRCRLRGRRPFFVGTRRSRRFPGAVDLVACQSVAILKTLSPIPEGQLRAACVAQ
eukprot:4957407-Lingulodinium_polyedra.AAC.1